ncbi:MAG TPA: hypothetical protein DCL54_06230 [Alphaproteobacteria bacterium]|nr:hypothetical protein [Alphaproteobacteria bacterium]HAJ46160.1 hypothetical protein [Alphaproteobacteria bacterium]
MIAVDSSTLVAYLQHELGQDVERFETQLAQANVVLPPVVISEVTSARPDDPELLSLLSQLRPLTLLEGYWERTGRLRFLILSNGRKSRLGDALIAQSCIDHNVALITRDTDFRHYAAHGGLTLA